ncbi:MAG: 30S ribosomal protein S5 [bacterium]
MAEKTNEKKEAPNQDAVELKEKEGTTPTAIDAGKETAPAEILKTDVPVAVEEVEEDVPDEVRPRRKRGDGRRRPSRDAEKRESDLFEKVVFINRCAKVVKGGRRFSFSALVVVGDTKGKVGIGFGKANEVSEAIRKSTEGARKRLQQVSVENNTVPHEAIGSFGGGRVLLRPASPGTGLIAGGGVRAVLEAVGVRDVLAKSLGSDNPANVVKATLDALSQMRKREEIFRARREKV